MATKASKKLEDAASFRLRARELVLNAQISEIRAVLDGPEVDIAAPRIIECLQDLGLINTEGSRLAKSADDASLAHAAGQFAPSRVRVGIQKRKETMAKKKETEADEVMKGLRETTLRYTFKNTCKHNSLFTMWTQGRWLIQELRSK